MAQVIAVFYVPIYAYVDTDEMSIERTATTGQPIPLAMVTTRDQGRSIITDAETLAKVKELMPSILMKKEPIFEINLPEEGHLGPEVLTV